MQYLAIRTTRSGYRWGTVSVIQIESGLEFLYYVIISWWLQLSTVPIWTQSRIGCRCRMYTVFTVYFSIRTHGSRVYVVVAQTAAATLLS
jgi:hypothetical protein